MKDHKCHNVRIEFLKMSLNSMEKRAAKAIKASTYGNVSS